MSIKNEQLRGLNVNLERLKARVRARVEHPSHVLKNFFGHKNRGYKGLKTNQGQCQVLLAPANILLARSRLKATAGG